MNTNPQWIVQYRDGRPPTCFPTYFDDGALVEVTGIGDSWAQFMEPRTGRLFDCADFARKMQEDVVR